MGKKAQIEQLNRTLSSHLINIHETFQVFDQTPDSNLKKVEWNEVVQMGDQVSKQATIAGMLWNGESPKAKAIEESMETYFNMLNGLLLLAHGSSIGAGTTLSSNIHAAVKQVVDCSFKLMKESVSLYGSHDKDQKLSIPQLAGTVWEACSTLKKVPSSNVTAIGRAVSHVAVSVKDVLREMKELKPASDDDDDEVTTTKSSNDDDDDFEDDLGNDLSPQEFKIAQAAILVVSDTLGLIKELIRTLTGMLKLEKSNSASGTSFVDSLEKILKLCREMGVQIDELGACLYPPQEISNIKVTSMNILKMVDDLLIEIESLESASGDFSQACSSLRSSLKKMEYELVGSDQNDLVGEMEKVSVSN
ncbi:hypothetical protein ACFE04_021889 [Oxalis oulophora]